MMTNTKSLKELDELPVFFIVGRGRSGSTLLRSLFDAHPRILIPLESRFVQYLYYNYPVKKRWTLKTAIRALDDLESGFEPLSLHRDTLMEALEKHASDLSLERVCKLIYLYSHSEFQKEEIQILGDKNPRYTFFTPQLLSLFPNARFIHLVRDYRDNIVSVQRAGKLIKESGNAYYSIGRWNLYNSFIIKCQKKYPDRFTRVHFEELIRDPELVMKNLCIFLDLDYDPEMLNYHKRLENYFREDGFTALHKSLQTPFDLSKIGMWEHELPQEKAIRCEVLGGRFSEKMGYPPRFNVHLFKRAGITLVYYPVVLAGQLRFILKILFYRSRLIMRMTYTILLKMK